MKGKIFITIMIVLEPYAYCECGCNGSRCYCNEMPTKSFDRQAGCRERCNDDLGQVSIYGQWRNKGKGYRHPVEGEPLSHMFQVFENEHEKEVPHEKTFLEAWPDLKGRKFPWHR